MKRYTTAAQTVARLSLADPQAEDEDSLVDSNSDEANQKPIVTSKTRPRSFSNSGQGFEGRSSPRVNSSSGGSSMRGSSSAVPLLHTDMLNRQGMDSSGELSNSARLAIMKIASAVAAPRRLSDAASGLPGRRPSDPSIRRLSDGSSLRLLGHLQSDIIGASPELSIRSKPSSKRGSAGQRKHSSSSPSNTSGSSPVERKSSVNLVINMKALSRRHSGALTSRKNSGKLSAREMEDGISQLQGCCLLGVPFFC